MIEYYLNLLNNKISRFYLVSLLVVTFINVFIFEMIYAIIANQIILAIILVLSLAFFFLNTLMQNIKEQYLSNYLYTLNTKKTISNLIGADTSILNSWAPDEIHKIITHGNYAIDNLLLLIENITYFIIKIVFNIMFIIFYKHNLAGLLSITLILIGLNIYMLLNNVVTRKTLNLDKLHNYTYYLMHGRLNYLTEFFHKQFKNIVEHITTKNNTSFVYLNFAITALYLYIGFNRFSLADKLYIVIYARNSSYIFTLVQNIILYYDNVKNNSTHINKVLRLPGKKIVKQVQMNDKFKIKITQLSYLGNNLDSELILNNNDKVILFGQSGIGKSTLFNIIKGLSNPDTLKLLINNKHVHNGFNQIQHQIMLVKHDTFKYFNESIREFIIEDYDCDIDLLNFLIDVTEMKTVCHDLDSNINNQNISSGQNRRLVLIKTFYQFYLSHKLILLLDELDNGIHQELFIDILGEIFQSSYYKDKLIMVISHNQNLHHNEELFDCAIEIKNNHIAHSRI